MLLLNMILGTLLIALTVIIHAIALDRITVALSRLWPDTRKRFYHTRKVAFMVTAVLAVFCAHIVEIWVWAGFYLFVEAVPNLETALYFSTVSFTTVGFGDVVLPHDWRLVGSFEGANGFMLFGWSTAYIFEIVSQIYKSEPGHGLNKP